MQFFLHILFNNIVPIFALIAVGYGLGRKFDLDVFTLSKLTFYVFVPSFILVSLYTTEIPWEMLSVIVFVLFLMALNFAISTVLGRLRGYSTGLSSAFKNSVMFYNSGNIGLPLVTLVFATAPFATPEIVSLVVTAQILVLVMQNITTYSFGIYNAGRATLRWQQSLIKVLKMPTIYAIPVALLFQSLPVDMTQTPIWPALEHARGALIAMALLTLGVQLSRTKLRVTNGEVYLAVAMRLLGGPLLAWILLLVMGLEGVLAQALLISSAVPTSVNSALIAVEMGNHSGFASQVVMVSTLLSALTMTLVIFSAQVLFPIL